MPWWGWALIAWTVLAFVLAPLIGMALREADRRDSQVVGAKLATAVKPRRQRLPLPPLAFALLLIGVVLEAIGFVVRASGNERGAGRLWSMDLPLAVPRMFIAALFLTAALAAAAAAVRGTGRRPWWTAVALVAAVVGEVKAGGTVHTQVLAALGLRDRPLAAVVASAGVVGVVLAVLWWLSRAERRDRRRVLVAFGIYALASVGLSGISSFVAQAGGSRYWQAAATFVEESGEAFGAVAVLVAVLVGVAPRLVLPADWLLRRDADSQTLDSPGTVPHRADGRLD
jgi:hypothetical protein